MAFNTAPFRYQVDKCGKPLAQIAAESGVGEKTTRRFYNGYYDGENGEHFPDLESVEKFMLYFRVSIYGIIAHSLLY